MPGTWGQQQQSVQASTSTTCNRGYKRGYIDLLDILYCCMVLSKEPLRVKGLRFKDWALSLWKVSVLSSLFLKQKPQVSMRPLGGASVVVLFVFLVKR